jgi:hypothetical protein
MTDVCLQLDPATAGFVVVRLLKQAINILVMVVNSLSQDYYSFNDFDDEGRASQFNNNDDPEYFAYECLSVASVEKIFNDSIETVRIELGVSHARAKQLLHSNKWSIAEILSAHRLETLYSGDPEAVIPAAGASSDTKQLSGEDTTDEKLAISCFVASSNLMMWCPAPSCTRAVRVKYSAAREVRCRCGHKFCFACGQDSHEPISCRLLDKWIQRWEDDSNTYSLLAANISGGLSFTSRDSPHTRCHSGLN